MNIDYNSEENYNVSFRGSDTTIERILSLKTTDFQNKKPGQFYIDEMIDWDHATLGAFLDARIKGLCQRLGLLSARRRTHRRRRCCRRPGLWAASLLVGCRPGAAGPAAW